MEAIGSLKSSGFLPSGEAYSFLRQPFGEMHRAPSEELNFVEITPKQMLDAAYGPLFKNFRPRILGLGAGVFWGAGRNSERRQDSIRTRDHE